MIKTEQRVEIYEDAEEAYEGMKRYIDDCWLVHTCVSDDFNVIVVYQRDLSGWN